MCIRDRERKAKERQIDSGKMYGEKHPKEDMQKSSQPRKVRDVAIAHDTLKRAEVPSNLRPVALAHRIGRGEPESFHHLPSIPLFPI